MNLRISRQLRMILGAFLLLCFVVVLVGPAAAKGSSGIVASVVKAPVASTGDVAGELTDLVINLDADMNPAVDGRSLLAGDTIKITLPDDFIQSDPPLPFQTAIFVCNPGLFNCNTGVLLQGWPQRPIPPPFYTISLEGTHTIVFTANQDLIPNTGPILAGIKQMHLILNGYTNPGPGMYEIQVEAETGPGGTLETGTGVVHILPNPRPSLHVTSVFNPGSPNSIYQTTTVDMPTTLSFDLLMWDSAGQPFTGVEFDDKKPKHGLLRHNGGTVGHVRVAAPKGAGDFSVSASGPSALVIAPVFGNEAGHMAFSFVAEDPGDYVVTFSFNGGNSAQMFVTVTD